MEAGRDYIGVSAGAVILNQEEKYFLARRSSGVRDDHRTWEFPGGSVKFLERREEAARRNVLEKHGLRIEIEQMLGVYEVIDPKRGDHWLSTTYLSRWVGGEPAILIPDKCDEIGWFSLEEMGALPLSRISQLNLKDLPRI